MSISSRHAESFIASNCAIAGAWASIPGDFTKREPLLIPTKYPFAPSLSQSSGQSYSSATCLARSRTSRASSGSNIITSTSFVDWRASKPNTMAAPPTRVSLTYKPRSRASSPRRFNPLRISFCVKVAISLFYPIPSAFSVSQITNYHYQLTTPISVPSPVPATPT